MTAQLPMRSIILLATALAAAACRHAAAAPQPAPLRDPPPPPLVSVIVPDSISVCVLRDGQAVRVNALYDPVTGDTLIDGRTAAESRPTSPPYAEGVEWYVRNAPVRSGGRMLMKYGLPRILVPQDVHPVGQYRGLTLFAEAGDDPALPSGTPSSTGSTTTAWQCARRCTAG